MVNETDAEKKRRQNRERQARWRARQSQETLERIRREDRDAHRNRIAQENQAESQVRLAGNSRSRERRSAHFTPEDTQNIRNRNTESQRRRRESETPLESQIRREVDLEAHHRRFARETLEQTQARISGVAANNNLSQINASQAIRNELRFFVEDRIDEHSCGPLNIACQFCGALNFKDEKPLDGKFKLCCRKGKLKLPPVTNVHGEQLAYPDFLRSLLEDIDNPQRIHFRENIRSYNSALSFASLGAKIVDVQGRGPYVFKIHGQTYHRTSHVLPLDNEAPQFAQVYMFDSTQATDIRQNHQSNNKCRREILDQIDRFMRTSNRLANTYAMMREIESRERQEAIRDGFEIPLVNMVLRRDRQSDQRRYNAPTSNEIAMVFMNEDGEPPFERDIRIYPRNPEDPTKQFININILSPNLDPMCYALMFPYGEPGWQPNWDCESYEGAQRNTVRTNVSMMQYKVAQTAIRGEFNPIIRSGKLTQQWIVDSYLQVEANNLNFIRQNQRKLRAEQYQGLADHVENIANANQVNAGVPVILPSSFQGSPRNMHERCCDAMSIFAKWGAPDLFITFTANPSWTEIIENLRPGEQTCDRPDLVARVFKIKLDSLINDITKHGVLGQSKAFVYAIEFQKRGLPHAHILVTLREEDKFLTPEHIDRFVSAEIPPRDQPRLREIVSKCMMHGPCGAQHPNAPCMDNGHCSKGFPKALTENTLRNEKGYPLYRRRIGDQIGVRGSLMDNRSVVPYNPYLTLRYNAHINVEICTSVQSVKYIYKYVFKGFDCANIAITSNGESELTYNEITNFIDCRYVSAPEAMWRLRESKMHDRSHTVVRLPVHLPNQQNIFFEEGNEAEALLAAETRRTKLESWFQLNTDDTAARNFLYTEIPLHYVYEKNEWRKRKRGANKVIARMYTVSVRDDERFCLRLLLLHTKGATCFEDLRTVEGVLHPSYKTAAEAKGLLESDDEWDRCLQGISIYKMPRQLRDTFAYICCFCHVTSPNDLWQKYCHDMSQDFQRTCSNDIALNKALFEIDGVLRQHGLSCERIGLPTPHGTAPESTEYDMVGESLFAIHRIDQLNDEQADAFFKITAALDDESISDRYFYLDGPGGSGKTFLYNALMSYIRAQGDSVLPFATTGIAATLLEGGKTVHSGFKLPVPLLDTSVSSMRLNSPEAEELRKAKLIIIDEITMLPKNGLRCIEALLREIMANNRPFGGKVFVVGGDFRQTLPVVPRGSRTEIVESCIKSSNLWKYFKKLKLSTNMRCRGSFEHNNWLLKVGENKLDPIPQLNTNNVVQIPESMLCQSDLVQAVFGERIEELSVEDCSKRVIVAPTNKNTLEMNNNIISSMPGELKEYCSADAVISEDSQDTITYPVEFLNSQTPSGMPPHKLRLKKGTIIMLLRNLNPKKGLCNGTRLMVEELGRNTIKAKIISQCNGGETVLLPRVDLAPSDTTLPFCLKRRQFPVIPAYAITINKSQGQTFEHVGVDLKTPVFAHGQLYVALSRSKYPENVKIRVEPSTLQGNLLGDDRTFTSNIVYQEIFME